jgi:hypothetical protein
MRRRSGRSNRPLQRTADSNRDQDSESDGALDEEWLPASKIQAESTTHKQPARKARYKTEAESWEADAARIITIVKNPVSGELKGLLAWKNGSPASYHPMQDLYENCPQLVRRPFGLHGVILRA